MRHLCDSNVFLAIAIGQHARHSVAAAWFGALAEADTVCFCRATRITFLRLLTQKIAADYTPLSNREAWAVLDRVRDDEAIDFVSEPDGLDPVWRELSEIDAASPGLWMDAYLASFAISAGMRLVTFDKDFRNYESRGLDLLLLRP